MLRKMITIICIFFKTRKKGGGVYKENDVSNTDKKFKIKSKNSDLNIKAGEF